MSHLVPAEAHKAAVVLRTVPPHHDVGLKVGFPLHPVRCGGCAPFGKVSGCVAFSPHMVPGRREKKRFDQTAAEGRVNSTPTSSRSERKPDFRVYKILCVISNRNLRLYDTGSWRSTHYWVFVYGKTNLFDRTIVGLFSCLVSHQQVNPGQAKQSEVDWRRRGCL